LHVSEIALGSRKHAVSGHFQGVKLLRRPINQKDFLHSDYIAKNGAQDELDCFWAIFILRSVAVVRSNGAHVTRITFGRRFEAARSPHLTAIKAIAVLTGP
jgi:hypothetical protein